MFLAAVKITPPYPDLFRDVENMINSYDKNLRYSTEVLHVQKLLNFLVKKLELKEFSTALRKVNRIVARFK